MGIKQDFRQTEIKRVPEDWEVKPLGNILVFQRGYDLPQRNRKEGDIPVISSSGIFGNNNRVAAC